MKMNSHIIRFKQGESIFKVGDRANCAYIIESGTVGLYPTTLDDDIIATLDKGDFLGEMGIIDGVARSTSAFAKTNLELMVIDREQITKRLQDSDPIIRGIMEVLLRRIRNMLNEDSSENPAGNNVNSESLIVAEGLHKIRFEHELFQALENNKIFNVYQPIVNLKYGYIAGFEALSRWCHPQKGMVSPFEFIALAEESNLILTMGLKVFDSACEQLFHFQEARDKSNLALPPLFMSINVSSIQLSDENFLLEIKHIVQKYQVEPSNIKIEITESLVVDYERVKTWIDDCQQLGFQLSLDDFGTGYSGFQHLLELDFHIIKIDQTFTKAIHTNPKSMIMLEVITDMAKRLNISIVAEGIEDLDSANKLSAIGVDYGQGYYFFKPMTAKELLKIFR
ncbi:diguanylate cyclase/phosphodiesterase (GGDEF & EAL domains) with PAS/PAC sensor(s) [hydrothermal vent metagenome]|uniref:Diguanylate cyclase/phosphodiesterase (GGDEF & EAL domains) with PAS/PAC sensor(S) n=1 Tax=hydrothermal vent metagenome TaxID=652676 RepID=A0A3B0VM58_9ZZZZ